jgi:transposase InsO family protein
MPWKISSALGERLRFVRAVLQHRKPFSVVCRIFAISRQCGYKWLQRFQCEGRTGLRNQSRRPRASPQRLSRYWRHTIRRLRRRRAHWGAKKIRDYLRCQFPRRRLPAVRTIAKWLPRLCPRPRRPRHSRRGPPLLVPPLTQPAGPNHVWTVDFKGDFRTGDGTRCFPLTVRDLFSRFVLAVRVLPHQRSAAVRCCFIRLFRRFGLPQIIRVDNGSPFGSTGAQGLSTLSVWWRTLGIAVEFIRPGHPEENGAHEQMHRELKRDTARPPVAHPPAQQRRSDRWRQDYNTIRPHEALGGRRPADGYRSSRRRYRGPQPLRYRRGWARRRVRHNGQIKWQGRFRSIGEAFVQHFVALRRQTHGIYEVYFQNLLLGTLHDRDSGGLRPVKRSRRHP